MSHFVDYALLFFIYSFCGWIVEVIYNFGISKKWVNRGFLIGPICPIYGWGSLLLIILLDRYYHDYFALFLGSIFICSVLEYWTSYFLEKIFKARWWDYSQMKYNINGRICLETMLPFGVFGAIIVGVVNPFIVEKISLINFNIKYIVCFFIIVLFIIDNIISFRVISKIKNNLSSLEADNTEEIKEKIKQIFYQTFLYRRFSKAFPDIVDNIRHKLKNYKKRKRTTKVKIIK